MPRTPTTTARSTSPIRIALFQFLFLEGEELSDPGTEDCGRDQTEDNLTCLRCEICVCPPPFAGTLAGSVVNALTGVGLPDLPIAIDPSPEGVGIVTDENGTFSAQLPIGVYTVTFADNNFAPQSDVVSIVAV